MAETNVKRLPFFVSDEEKKGLANVPQDNLADQLKEAVPEFKEVTKGEVIGSFGVKDGLLVYHFYKKDRRTIYVEAHKALEATKNNAQQQEIARKANIELAKHPWWPNFEQMLDGIFSEHFKYTDRKITYYPEVDSWSVIMPEPKGLAMPDSHLEAAVSKVALRVGG